MKSVDSVTEGKAETMKVQENLWEMDGIFMNVI